jgi:hypothetical protein
MCLAYMLALAIGTTGVITIVIITIVITVVADGIHITGADRVGLFRAATVRRTRDRVAQVGVTVKRDTVRRLEAASGGLLF